MHLIEEVVGMFSRRKTLANNSGTTKPENRLLRLLESSTGFSASLTSLEKADQEDDYYACGQKEIKNAMLEAECKKAEAVQAIQQYRRFV
jgi:hypothetical protein